MGKAATWFFHGTDTWGDQASRKRIQARKARTKTERLAARRCRGKRR